MLAVLGSVMLEATAARAGRGSRRACLIAPTRWSARGRAGLRTQRATADATRSRTCRTLSGDSPDAIEVRWASLAGQLSTTASLCRASKCFRGNEQSERAGQSFPLPLGLFATAPQEALRWAPHDGCAAVGS